MERRLTAILVADVVGYSRLMEADEASVLEALQSRREELIDPIIAKHHGRIVKLMGDGALVEFASVVHAVTGALAILEGRDEILTMIRLGLPAELRRSLGCTNIIENMLGSVRQVSRNVKRWRNAAGAALHGRRHARGLVDLPVPAA
jgi:hypothetical protein